MYRTSQKILKQSHMHKYAQAIFDETLSVTPLVMREINKASFWDDIVQNWQHVQTYAKDKETWGVTQEFRDRITVNYIRHRCTNYDHLRKLFLEHPYNSRLQFLLHQLLKTQVLDLISQTFPKLHKECQLQKVQLTRPIQRR